ncbi:MAG: FAD:protein FMN transferase [Chlamydiales bacterium]
MLITGCATPCSAPQHLNGIAMTMTYTVQIGDPNPDLLLVKEIITSTFSEIDKIYNNWNPQSEVSQLNCLSANEKYWLSPELANFLQLVEQIVELTEGRFDPTIGSIKEDLFKKHLQSEQNFIGWKTIHLEGNCFWKEHCETLLDLGGIAKGYAVDLLIERLQDAGFQNLFVEWGGEIRVTGQHPQQRPWRVAIFGGEIVELNEEAIATSGNYFQKWTIEGKTYTHIIDPKTTLPLTEGSIESASVVMKTCCEADAVATALMLFSSEEEAYLWAKSKNLKIWLF